MRRPKAILVIRFSSIGDIVLATSPLKSIRSAFPGARIDFLTLDKFQDILLFHPAIDRHMILRSDASRKEVSDFARNLRTEKYDLVVDLHNSLRSKLIRSKLHGIKTTVLKKPRWKRFKLFTFHANHFESGFSQRSLYHEPLKQFLPAEYSIPLTKLTVKTEEKSAAKTLLAENGVNDSFFAIIPSAAWKQKEWSAKRYAEAAKSISEKTGLKGVILGGKGDTICLEISKANPDCTDFHGKLSLRESMSVLSLANFAVGSDTGLMHAAEALGIPVTMIMGPTSVETGGGVQLESSTVIALEHLWCRPCSQNGKRPCYRNEQICLTGISANAVAKSALKTAGRQ
ncbi:MAG: glycosyltransferase family 9 protein [Candidatus Marinimicrobia bacterium]|jgi:ADP-heptose:LPS heptosyltransferase|nr:glycosyltransferase family 9 protein [Candidatus Neomarinimicrobiota bacterium]